MLRHVVVLKCKPGTAEERIRAAIDGVRSLIEVVPSLRRIEVGRDAGVVEGNGDLVIVADFDDAEGYLAYARHASHLEVIGELITPIALARSAVQYERPDVS